MKKEHWKYLTISLSVISIVFLAYGFLFSSAMGISIIEYAPINVESTDYKTVSITTTEQVFQPLASDGVEVIQDEWTAGLYISKQRPCIGYAQSIVFDGTRHTNGFCMMIARVGEPTEPIVLGLDYQKSLGESYEIHRSVSVCSDDLPKELTWYWIGNLFDDDPFVESSLFVTAVSLDSQHDDNYWLWAFSDENPYSGGMMLQINPDGTYGDADSSWDGTFAIYTEEAGGGEPPSISISITTIIQTTGFIALLGACFSGIKYGMLVGWL